MRHGEHDKFVLEGMCDFQPTRQKRCSREFGQMAITKIFANIPGVINRLSKAESKNLLIVAAMAALFGRTCVSGFLSSNPGMSFISDLRQNQQIIIAKAAGFAPFLAILVRAREGHVVKRPAG